MYVLSSVTQYTEVTVVVAGFQHLVIFVQVQGLGQEGVVYSVAPNDESSEVQTVSLSSVFIHN